MAVASHKKAVVDRGIECVEDKCYSDNDLQLLLQTVR